MALEVIFKCKSHAPEAVNIISYSRNTTRGGEGIGGV